MTDTERLAERLLQWEERWEHGEDVSASELCPDCPELTGQLQHQIDILKKMAWMKEDAEASGDGEDEVADLLAGTTLDGRYRLDQFIAEGGFGRVYRGFDLELQRPVAVKIARRAGMKSSDDLLEEARKVARLRHPGIVSVHDVGRTDEFHFIVEDLIEGNSVAEIICGNRPTPEDTARLVADMADALDFAHENGFVHRDIKPANILLDKHGKPLITDFGIASSTTDTLEGRTAGSGTLAYMAPEQLAGEIQLIDHRVDVYALGVVLYQLLTGSLPHQARTPTALREQVLFRLPRSIRDVNHQVPASLEQICLRCLAKHPADRFANAEELAVALRSGLQQSAKASRRRVLAVAVLAFAALAMLAVGSLVLWPRLSLLTRADGQTEAQRERLPDSPDTGLDRDVAARILGMGGEVQILTSQGRTRLLDPSAIPATRFCVTEIKILSRPDFGDDDLQRFVGLPRLESLFVAATSITDHGMRYVASIPTLRGLGVGNSQVSDAGVAELVVLKNLSFLNLNNTKVTNEVFPHLSRIENLRQLDLRFTAVSKEAMERFRRQRPDCRVQP